MSNVTNNNGVTAPQSPTGIQVIQVSDFYQQAGILHPITVGTIAIILLFVYLRLSSNRVVAPMTLFDWLLNVALGSTLAGIVNGTSLVRGLLSLATLMAFQLIASQLSSHYGLTLERVFNSPALVIAFRGTALRDVMRKHRISQTDLNSALRQGKVWNIREVEAVIIEPTGTFTIYKIADRPEPREGEEEWDAEVLMDVPGYRRLVERFDRDGCGGEKGVPDHMKTSKGGKGGKMGADRSSEDASAEDVEMEAGTAMNKYSAVKGDLRRDNKGRAVKGVKDVVNGVKTDVESKAGRMAPDKDQGDAHSREKEKAREVEKEKTGGQGGDGETTGIEREANDIAQSEA